MQDYGFVVVLADEGVTQLEWFLGHLRSVYPDAPVTVISDGIHDRWYEPCCRRHGVEFVESQYLKRVECGGRWWRRTLEAGLAMDVRWIVKIDPDARVWRRFAVEPPHDISGTLEHEGREYENIQGGCQAITASVAKRILDSRWIDDEILRGHDRLAPDWESWRRCNASAYLSTDWSLMWVARNLGLSHGDWSECGCNWRPPAPDNRNLRYAVTHPVKFNRPPQCLGSRLQVITTCKGRLDHLKQTLPRWLAEPGVDVIVVDYDCPQNTAQWCRDNHPEVTVVHATGLPKFCLAAARNLGLKYAKDGWICFWDADWVCEPGWSEAIRHSLKHRHYLLCDPIEWSQFGSVVVHSYDARTCGAYDELFRAWGSEDSDFYARLRYNGIRPGSFPSRYFSSLKHDDGARVEHYDVKDRDVSRVFYDAYIQRKRVFMESHHRIPDLAESKSLLAETQKAVGSAATASLYQAQTVSPASVQFYPGTPRQDTIVSATGAADHLMPDLPQDHATLSPPTASSVIAGATLPPNPHPVAVSSPDPISAIAASRFGHGIQITNHGTIHFGTGNDLSGAKALHA